MGVPWSVINGRELDWRNYLQKTPLQVIGVKRREAVDALRQ
jgi:hypothetical protein